MRTFLTYDSGTPGIETWGTSDPKMVLKKIANWIPFIKVNTIELELINCLIRAWKVDFKSLDSQN